jgi:hypothetical protein
MKSLMKALFQKIFVDAAHLAAVDGSRPAAANGGKAPVGRAFGPATKRFAAANMAGDHVGKNRNFKNVPPSAAPTSATSRLLVTIKHSLYFPYSFGKENFYEISKT